MGFFDQQPIAQATNSAAQQSYGRTGKMVKRTVGGLFGGALPNPSNVPTPQQTLGLATGNQYAPMHQAPLATAPTTQAGYGQQMQAQNPGGSLFGGALPALGTSSGGQTRPMFFGPPAAPEANPGFNKNAFAASHGLFVHPETGTISPNSALAAVPAGQVRSMQTQGYASPGLGFAPHKPAAPVAEADRYGKLGLVAPSQRSGGPGQTAKQVRMLARAEAQKQQFEQGLGLASPNAYAQLQQGRGNQALAQQQANAANIFRHDDLAARERMNTANNKSREAVAGLGLQGKGIDPATGKPIDTRTPEQQMAAAPDPADLHLLSPAERQERVAGLPAATQQRLLSQADRKGYFSRLFGGIDQPGPAPVSEALKYGGSFGRFGLGAYDPFGRILSAGINTPELVRPTTKSQRDAAHAKRAAAAKAK